MLLVNLCGTYGTCAPLIYSRLGALPHVHDIFLWFAVCVQHNIAVPASELAMLLGRHLRQLKLLNPPDLHKMQSSFRMNECTSMVLG